MTGPGRWVPIGLTGRRLVIGKRSSSHASARRRTVIV